MSVIHNFRKIIYGLERKDPFVPHYLVSWSIRFSKVG